jgi:eIF4-gamma/eIF5/eIF2-epsilon
MSARFANLAVNDPEEGRSRFRNEPPPQQQQPRGPPPVQNSRFAAAAEADRAVDDGPRGGFRPPPNRADAGPPPPTNSRFAAAAQLYQAEQQEQQQRRPDREGAGGYYNNNMDRRGGPPPTQNSRFANAAAMDNDYVDRDERHRRTMERDQEDRGGDRGYDDRRGGHEDRRGGGGGYHDERRGGGGGYEGRRHYDDRRPPGPADRSSLPTGPKASMVDSGPSVEELLKKKMQPKSDNAPLVLEKLDATHAENVLKIPAKALSRDQEENIFAVSKKKESKKEEAPKEASPPPSPSAVVQTNQDLLQEFVSATKLGKDLKAWCETNRMHLPSVEQLVLAMLNEKEKSQPDPECAWADPDKYGSALLDLIDEDVNRQMQVLWAIQAFCDDIGFPKIKDEYLVQSMFRAMYKFDLAGDDAFSEWKEDFSEAHDKGKKKAVIQTLDWFTWLEQEEEEEEDESE